MIACVRCFKEVSTTKIVGRKFTSLRHVYPIANLRMKREYSAAVMSPLFYVYEWCTDKRNCKSCIQIVDRKQHLPKRETNLSAGERHRRVMRNFDFQRQKIICVHCSKEQKRAAHRPTGLNSHIRLTKSKVLGNLFQKMSQCPDENCRECLRIEDRYNQTDKLQTQLQTPFRRVERWDKQDSLT